MLSGQPAFLRYNGNFTLGGVFMQYVAEVYFSGSGQVGFFGTRFPVRKQGI